MPTKENKCSVCRGQKQILTYPMFSEARYKPCPACKGTGKRITLIKLVKEDKNQLVLGETLKEIEDVRDGNGKSA